MCSPVRADEQSIAVYTGDVLESLSEMVSADAWPLPLDERAVFEAVAGTEYRDCGRRLLCRVRHGHSGDEGLFELEIYVVPPNDDFADADACSTSPCHWTDMARL